MPATITRPTSLAGLSLTAAVVLVAAVLLVASPARAGGMEHAVEIVDFAYSPATLTITAGDTVSWTNADAVGHTATSTTGAFDSGDLAQGESYSLTFTNPGTYDYLCTPHPSMTGRIVVVAAAAPAPTAAPVATAAPQPGGGVLPDVAMARPSLNVPLIAGIALLLAAAALSALAWRRGRTP